MRKKATIGVLLSLLLACVPALGKRKPRVHISDSQSWQMTGGVAGSSEGFFGASRGGARPQTAEIIKTFNKKCAGCIVTMKSDRADYIVLLDHEGGKGLARKDNKFVVFNKEGDAIKSGSTRTLGNSVKNACKALMEDWKENK